MLAMDVSSTSMNTATITVSVMSHGLWRGCHIGWAAAADMGHYLPLADRLQMKWNKTAAAPARIIAASAVTKSGTLNGLTRTRAITDSPGPIVRSAGSGSSKIIFTGTRWTTFTKLPAAFSGGSKLN